MLTSDEPCIVLYVACSIVGSFLAEYMDIASEIVLLVERPG